MAIGAIVLAAGRSTRMGRNKALLEHEGRSFLEGIVAKLRLASCAPVVVVAARPDTDVAAAAARAGARVAHNPDPERGELSSLLAGLDLLERAGVEALLVWPVDHPAVGEATVMALRLAWEHTRAPVVVAEHKGKRGHPVLFSRAVFAELRAAPVGEGAGAVVRAHEADGARVEVDDPGIHLDIDSPEDLARLPGARKTAPGSAPRREQG